VVLSAQLWEKGRGEKDGDDSRFFFLFPCYGNHFEAFGEHGANKMTMHLLV